MRGLWLKTFTGLALMISQASGGPAPAAGKLPRINADPHQSSISGISSGAFMAVQFATAWSSTIAGLGVVTGGPFYCAQAMGIDWTGLFADMMATGPCMKGPAPAVSIFTGQANTLASQKLIDSTDHIQGMKIYLFHGNNDTVVAKSVVDTAAAFFKAYLGQAGAHNLFYQDSLAAGHSQPILNRPGVAGLNACPDNASPYIDQCGYDAAGVILQHIYGALNPRNGGKLQGKLISFDQSLYTPNFTADLRLGTDVLSLGKTGYVYVPQDCAAGAACRVHIALHGCKQDVEDIGKRYIHYAGYNEWADTNGIVVLYPQTTMSFGPDAVAPVNPEACWDWFAYVNHSSDYVTKSGRQITTLKNMLDALASGFSGAPPSAGSFAAPAELAAIDASSQSVDLAWRAVPGANSYRVERKSAAGGFASAGTVAGPSFGDSGLSPSSLYTYRVVAIGGAGESPASSSVDATTRAGP